MWTCRSANAIICLPYWLDIYELLKGTSSRIVRVAAASGLAQGFRIILPPKVKIKNSTSSVYSRLYGIFQHITVFETTQIALFSRDAFFDHNFLHFVQIFLWAIWISVKWRSQLTKMSIHLGNIVFFCSHM